jgi:prepilin-type N-terminal cleavage/methylation domain-containing protein
MMNRIVYIKTSPRGFTLVEIAIVLLIVALLLGGLVPTLSGQIENRRISDTGKQLAEIQEALIGYAIINGRLPCPASSTSNGAESFASGGSASNGNCSNFHNGFVPAATLGLSGTNGSGYVVDAWGNPIRYAVTSWLSVFTTAGGMSAKGISSLAPTLLVCSTAPSTGTSCNSGTSLTSNGVPAVIFSTSKNGPLGHGADEAANLDGNITFVNHTPTPSPNEFDDIMIWMSPNVLINRMVAAGQLP